MVTASQLKALAKGRAKLARMRASAPRSRRYTPRLAKTLAKYPPFMKYKSLSKKQINGAMRRTAAARKAGARAVLRNKINIAADRQWAARLVPVKRYIKGANARRFDLGVKVGGRMRRVFD
jgi:hypothetical protein